MFRPNDWSEEMLALKICVLGAIVVVTGLLARKLTSQARMELKKVGSSSAGWASSQQFGFLVIGPWMVATAVDLATFCLLFTTK